MTYGQVAKLARVKSPRLVGRALHLNDDPINIPCHRVVFANGSLSASYAFGGPEMQKQKLHREGVQFVENKVELVRFTFRPNPISL